LGRMKTEGEEEQSIQRRSTWERPHGELGQTKNLHISKYTETGEKKIATLV